MSKIEVIDATSSFAYVMYSNAAFSVIVEAHEDGLTMCERYHASDKSDSCIEIDDDDLAAMVAIREAYIAAHT